MTVKRCLKCGNPFSNRKSGYTNFCSEKCKNKYYDLLEDKSYSNSQIERDLKLKQKAEVDDFKRRKGIE